MRHFAAAIAQRDLNLVALFEEPHHRAELDLLDLNGLLTLAGFGGFLLSRIFVLPVVHDLTDGRADIWRNLDQIHASFLGHPNGHHRLDRASVLTGLVDQLDLRVANIIIDARPVFGGRGRGSIGTANGWFSKVVKGSGYFEGRCVCRQASRSCRDRNPQMRGFLVTPLGTVLDIDTLLPFRKRPKRSGLIPDYGRWTCPDSQNRTARVNVP